MNTNAAGNQFRSQLQSFRSQIAELVEKDYGDWQRKVNLYLDRLLEASPDISQAGRESISRIRQYAVYSPSQDIEQTRSRILRDLDALN